MAAEPVCHTWISENEQGNYKKIVERDVEGQLPPCALQQPTALMLDKFLEKPGAADAKVLSAVAALVNEALKEDKRFETNAGVLVHLVRYKMPPANGKAQASSAKPAAKGAPATQGTKVEEGGATSSEGTAAAKQPASGAEPAVERDLWLTCNKGGKHVFNKTLSCSPDLRLLGTRNVAVLFVHTNIKLIRFPTTTPMSAEAAAKLVNVPLGKNGYAGQVTYYAVAKAKLPTPLEHLLGIFKLIVRGEAHAPEARVALLGFGWLSNAPNPSNITAIGVSDHGGADDGSARLGHKAEVLNEGLYFYDFSICVPVNKLSLLEVSESDNNFSPKEINKQSVYGTFSLYPWWVDLSRGGARYWLPRALVGLGLTGRPGDNFMVGGASGFSFFQFFVGSAFARHNVKAPGEPGGTPNKLVGRYGSRLTYGINVPVFSAIQKVSAKKK